MRYVFTDSFCDEPPEAFADVKTFEEPPYPERKDGTITFKEAIKEAMIEEMLRDGRVILYGEDVADYGGAFKVTKGLLETFGRARVFNASIPVTCAMIVLRPEKFWRPIVFDFCV